MAVDFVSVSEPYTELCSDNENKFEVNSEKFIASLVDECVQIVYKSKHIKRKAQFRSIGR